ncbi:membrane anchored protein in chemotaxis locus [Shewanella maritima]|uniref:membrane anchored protein in chemotaxis locus n=1 Tax=Shewanella maritima TaxID=2520507 RepID=UPI001F5E8815|nr:membrane anchored protein in chemotaxis locus [Shewanella maritima]
MAKAKSYNPLLLLISSLLIIALLVVLMLYLNAAKLNKAQQLEIEELKASQILLMVPDEQAQEIATWMANHPEQTKAFIEMAKSSPEQKATVGSATPPSTQQQTTEPEQGATTEKQSNDASNANRHSAQQVVVSENEDGVKVISLPNGGIRVTTRELDDTNR